jgi:hypothetical protein
LEHNRMMNDISGSPDSQQLCSGFGQYHSPNNKKDPREYQSATINDILAMLPNPISVAKGNAQWVIFSTLPSRIHAEQRAQGRFYALWADIDDTQGKTFSDSVSRAGEALLDFIAYTSRSATEANQKMRIIVPLAGSVSGEQFVIMQKILNDKLIVAGIIPDRATERAGQVCYLPNRGEYYRYHVEKHAGPMACEAWDEDAAQEKERTKAAQRASQEAREQARIKAAQRMASGCKSSIDAFNAEYPLLMMFDTYGYIGRGNRWLSPNSVSGSPGVTLSADGRKWLSTHGSDAGIGRPTSNGTMGDAFDLFTYYQHGGNRNAAIMAARDMFIIDGETINPVNQRDCMQRQNLEDTPDTSAQAIGLSRSGTWPTLTPLENAAPARLPIEQWPPVLRDYAIEASRETETPVELPALLALGCVAAAIQKVLSVKIKPGYVEPCCLNAVLVLPPATRKSAEITRAIAPIVKWEAEQRLHFAEAIKRAESLLATHKARVQELRKRAIKERSSDKAIELAAELAALEASEPTVPVSPRLFTSDVTTEHLATMMGNHGGAMAVISSEGGIFETMAGRYSQQMPNFDLYLQAHAGDPVRVDRGSKAPIILDNPRLTMALTIQPDVLTAMGTKAGFKGRGLLGRVLFCLPPSTLGHRTGNTLRMSYHVQEAYNNMIGELIDVAHTNEPYTLELSTEVVAAWKTFWCEVETKLADGGQFEHCRDWAGKLPGAVGRIAALFHSACHPDQLATKKIELCDMHAAISTGWVLAEHALAAFGFMGADPAVEDAKLVLKWVLRRRLMLFTARDVQHNYGSRFAKADDVLPALGVLEERGYIRQRYRELSAKGGRSTSDYEVNPIILN